MKIIGFKIIIFLLIITSTSKTTYSQENNSSDSIHKDSITKIKFIDKPFQLTLIHPLGTHFTNLTYVNKLSINLLIGYEAGLNGNEFGLVANIDKYFVKGLQIAGFVNSTKGFLEGTQVSFLLNKATNVKGKQIGLINVCDTLEGKQIGFLNITHDNYKSFEIWATECFYLNMGFKIGSEKFYKILAIGLQPVSSKFKSGVGIGFGTEKELKNNKFRIIEGIALQVNENEIFTTKLNLLNSIYLNFGMPISKNTKFYYGVSLNFLVSKYFDSANNRVGSDVAPWKVYDKTYINKKNKKTNYQLWPGLILGFKL